MFDDGFGVRLDFFYHAQDFGDLGVECAGFAVENVAVGVGSVIVVVRQLGIVADLAVVVGAEL